jgi:hypothetical protein
MRVLPFLALCLVGLAFGPSSARAADPIFAPERGSPLRAALLDAARPIFEQEIGGSIEFVVRTLNVMGGWAYGDVKLQRPGGAPIDWSKTKFADDSAQGMLETDHNLFLLQHAGGQWQLVAYAIGPTDVAWDDWRQQRRLPAELFGASSADFPPVPPAPSTRPRSGD